MSENTLGIADMLASVLNKEPASFKDAFNSTIMDKVHGAIESRRMEVARTAFTGDDEAEVSSDESAIEIDAGTTDSGTEETTGE